MQTPCNTIDPQRRGRAGLAALVMAVTLSGGAAAARGGEELEVRSDWLASPDVRALVAEELDGRTHRAVVLVERGRPTLVLEVVGAPRGRRAVAQVQHELAVLPLASIAQRIDGLQLEGGRLAFRVAPLGPKDFGARIYHVGRVADPATRQVEVLAWVDPAEELKPGFFAEVTLEGEKKENALVVPEGAIQASERGFVTYVVEDHVARMRPVDLGLRTGTGVVEILSGVAKGDVVVSEGSDRLADGMPVEGVEGAAPAAADAAAKASR